MLRFFCTFVAVFGFPKWKTLQMNFLEKFPEMENFAQAGIMAN
jgi:hypothetical protein